jgi:membrane associated rhomboid family serine protease
MLPLGDNVRPKIAPLVTWTMVGLNCLVFFWDRQGHVSGPSVVFADLGLRPRDLVNALSPGGDQVSIATLFTSMFLHASVWHLLGNMLFLWTFGPAIEAALGSPRYALYYLFWGIVAGGTHVLVDPSSPVPTIGASGAIGGVLGCYFLLFPANKIEFIVPLFPIPLAVSAWILLGTWFLWQIFVRQEGVANWAHAGGFMAGMATVLIMGGRRAVLKARERELEVEYE